jgi:hypothetical protein
MDIVDRSGMRARALPILAALFVFCCTSATAPPSPSPFEFRSGVWLNLHHFLRAVARGMPAKAALSDEERAAWSSAVEFYKPYAQRDVIRDDGMVAIKNALADRGNAPTLDGAPIDAALRETLERAAPIYRKYWWPAHEASHRSWIAQAQPFLIPHAVALSRQVPAALDAAWPDKPVPVELSVTAGPDDAYTTDGPRTTLASPAAGYRGPASLEILFHEASHAWGARLFNGVARAAREQNKKVPRQLWHAVLFYNAGELTRRRYAAARVDYVELAQAANIYKDLCGDGCRDRVKAAWDRHLSGQLTTQQALDELVRSSPGEP